MSTTTAVNTKKVSGRRTVHYESYEDFLADAERLAQTSTRTLGNWSQGQIYHHLASSLDSSIDGTSFSLPAPMRFILTLLMKKKFLTKAVPAGFDAPEEFQPPETDVADALAALRKAVDRQRSESQRAKHPAFGNISREEWDQFNLRHAELHMSFLLNGDKG